MRKILLLSFVFLCYIGKPVIAQDTRFQLADSLFNLAQKKQRAMGSVCIRKNGKIEYQRSFGWAEALARVRSNDSTAYRIGSISKVFTSVIIHQLIEEKKLKLDQKLGEFFPDWKNVPQVTIAQLLNHSSGLHNITDDSVYATYYTSFQTHDEMLERITKNPLDFPPGSKHSYSNTNYVLLGYIIEQLSGDDYGTQVKKRIAKPLGLRRTYAFRSLGTQPNEARSYERSGNEWKDAGETDWSIPHGAGALASTPADLTLFIHQLMTGKLVKDESLANMKKLNDGYGSGLFQFPFNNKKAWGHNGGIDGFSSMMVWMPEDSVSIACVFNGLDTEMNDLLIGLFSIYYNYPYKIPDFSRPDVVLTSDELMLYPGTYSCKDLPLKISIREESGKFYAQATGQSEFPLTAFSKVEFRFELAGITILFKPADPLNERQYFSLIQVGKIYDFVKDVEE